MTNQVFLPGNIYLLIAAFNTEVVQTENIRNKGQARLFNNNLLEIMTKTHPVIVYSMYFPVIGWMLYRGAMQKGISMKMEIALFFAGILFWTLFEYVMHRFIFHLIEKYKPGSKIAYIIHGVHHEYPRDKTRLFMPPVPSVIIASIVFALMFLLLGQNALAFFPGFLSGYILYGSMHYAIHAFAPPRWLKALWRNHHLHHYKTPDKGFGVSSVLWDVVFGTVPDKDATQQK